MVDYLQEAMKQPDIDLIRSMKQQMKPSPESRDMLLERLAAVPNSNSQKKEKTFMKQWKPLALAACTALVLCAYPAYHALAPRPPVLHSYTTIDGSDPAIKAQYREETTAQGVDKGGEEEGPNTGELPGGAPVGIAPVGEAPVQPGADAYQLLMDHFGGVQPDWYGGAYIADNGTLMVLLVNDKDSGDKTLELDVLEAVGGKTAPVGFAGAKYSRNDLERMNGELIALLDGKGIQAAWGIYDDENRIVLDVGEPLTDDLLAAIAEIDPDDDAILIRVVEGQATVTDEQFVKGPAPIGEGVDAPDPGGVTVPDVDTVEPEEGENPTVHFATDPGTVAPDDEDLEAIEPYYDGGVSDLPQQKLPGKVESAHHDLLPVE